MKTARMNLYQLFRIYGNAIIEFGKTTKSGNRWLNETPIWWTSQLEGQLIEIGDNLYKLEDVY